MPEWLTELFASDPSYTYLAVALIFVLCGVGLPLPEEIVLVSAGYICYQGHATYWIMTLVCAGAILVGDIIPFSLGRLFGPRLLRLRWIRLVVNRERLAMFDRWFRRRGDLVIMIARFIPGLRVVAFFTGGTMRMRWLRFMILDTCGIVLVAPTFVFVGYHFGQKIEETYRRVQQVENSILILTIVGALVGSWYWVRRRAKRRRLVGGPSETFVEQAREPSGPDGEAGPEKRHEESSGDGSAADATARQAPEPGDQSDASETG